MSFLPLLCFQNPFWIWSSDEYCPNITSWDRQNLGLWDYRATFLLRSRAFAIWMCPVLVPSPVSTTPEFEVTWVGVWGYVGEVFAALESSHQRSHLPFTHSSGALPWLVSVIDTIFTSKAIHPNILLWTFSYICKKERKRKILQLQIQTCSCLENEPNTCFLATFHNRTKNQLNSLWRAIIALPFPIQRAEAEGW